MSPRIHSSSCPFSWQLDPYFLTATATKSNAFIHATAQIEVVVSAGQRASTATKYSTLVDAGMPSVAISIVGHRDPQVRDMDLLQWTGSVRTSVDGTYYWSRNDSRVQLQSALLTSSTALLHTPSSASRSEFPIPFLLAPCALPRSDYFMFTLHVTYSNTLSHASVRVSTYSVPLSGSFTVLPALMAPLWRLRSPSKLNSGKTTSSR